MFYLVSFILFSFSNLAMHSFGGIFLTIIHTRYMNKEEQLSKIKKLFQKLQFLELSQEFCFLRWCYALESVDLVLI
ncbi:hypothetical protein BCV72DRAFT_236962 [Rhizopus microsporus var. microsporus]|uniref:Uncharacterized protein n=2 Tax=Rhizopus microsporus TaxID=58291 RepID=A0A2G4SJ66_RHIZD|nr:uncharacterized protein RHIMIDRAFT_267777 [Rhizopus microsporus ATCC 52813]ORE01083.1 hypothetical protein BCV72DRAFT_236962 [Rhizopus microsporus var. microsporus]PHZ08814.1 hypothetical protein RHIMIDRAFT_267777 [Rhizopus microsporus ATCC 52813]